MKKYDRSIPFSEKDQIILKLTELRVVAFAQFAKWVKRPWWLCGYWVPKTYFS